MYMPGRQGGRGASSQAGTGSPPPRTEASRIAAVTMPAGGAYFTTPALMIQCWRQPGQLHRVELHPPHGELGEIQQLGAQKQLARAQLRQLRVSGMAIQDASPIINSTLLRCTAGATADLLALGWIAAGPHVLGS
eukprot:COSAG01_NODE_37618_length_501_cov_0.639303_1_plen_134_part_10